MRALRWSDDDRYFGPFTYANERKGGKEFRRLFGAYISSGGDDEEPVCRLRFHLLGHTLIVRLPALFKPAREWHELTTEPSRSMMIAQGREPGYWQVWERAYGFLFYPGALHIDYGAQTHDSTTNKSKVFFLPWRETRFLRHSFYGLAGEHYATEPRGMKWTSPERAEWDKVAEACPAANFAFEDFDGEQLTATTRIEEREWAHGVKAFKWLSLFRRNIIRRSLDIRFSGETGRRKGSWKGGTIGCSIDMQPGELHESAFRRYCAENNMRFVG